MPIRWNVKCRRIFQELISWGPHSSSEIERKEFVVASLRPPENVQLVGIFTSKSCSDDKEIYKKKRNVRAKLLFCLINLLLSGDFFAVAVAVVVAKAPKRNGKDLKEKSGRLLYLPLSLLCFHLSDPEWNSYVQTTANLLLVAVMQLCTVWLVIEVTLYWSIRSNVLVAWVNCSPPTNLKEHKMLENSRSWSP